MPPNLVQHGFWYYNWGNVFSVTGVFLSSVGIGFTIWTLRTAQSAERAALQAKNNAATHAFVNDARRAESYLRELITHLRSTRFGDAAYRSTDLTGLLGEMNEVLPRRGLAEQELVMCMVQARDDCEQNDKVIRKFVAQTEQPTNKEIERAVSRANSAHAAIMKIRVGITPE